MYTIAGQYRSIAKATIMSVTFRNELSTVSKHEQAEIIRLADELYKLVEFCNTDFDTAEASVSLLLQRMRALKRVTITPC